jgi:ketosteroid isomerase-like protein
MGALLDHVQSYYDSIAGGEVDPDAVAAHFTDDAVHYFTRLPPAVGGRAIADYAVLGVRELKGRWTLEHGIDNGEEAVIEWSMTWVDPRSGAPRLDRGTEWFRFRDGLICEVRAYHHSDAKNRSGDLLGFDHEGRGFTTLE